MGELIVPTRAPSGPSRLTVLVLVVLAAAVAVGALVVLSRLNRRGPNEFVFGGTDLRKVDPALVKYGQVLQIETGMKEVRGVAVGADGKVYVAGDKAVAIFGADGKRSGGLAADATPTCLTVAKDGAVYVGYGDHVRVWVMGSERGERLAPAGNPLITGIAVGPAGEVAIADAQGRSVELYDAGGKLIGQHIGKPGLVAYSAHLDVAFAADGGLWVTNPGNLRVEKYARDGRRLAAWGEAGTAVAQFVGCCNPSDIAVLPDGGIVTSEKGVPRVKVYSADGTFQGFVAAPSDFREGDVLAVATDAAGRVYVLDPARRSVRVFAKKEGPQP